MLEALLGNSKSSLDSFINMCMSHNNNKYLFSYSSRLMKACVTYANAAGSNIHAAAAIRSLLSEPMVYIY